MTQVIGDTIILGDEPGICEMCGEEEDLRPYGPNGENVCYACGMKDKQAAAKACNKRLFHLSDEDAEIAGKRLVEAMENPTPELAELIERLNAIVDETIENGRQDIINDLQIRTIVGGET